MTNAKTFVKENKEVIKAIAVQLAIVAASTFVATVVKVAVTKVITDALAVEDSNL